MDLKTLLKSKPYIILDGATGTELQKKGMKPGEAPYMLNFSAPEIVAEVVDSYAVAGADIVSTNTFGVNRYKLRETGIATADMIAQAVKLAANALSARSDILLAQDISPIGQLLKPTGSLSFGEAYDMFAEQITAGVNAGVDLFFLQTFSDLLEIKAALLAVKENSNLPVICAMTFERNGRTFTGCPASAAALTLSGLGADAIGVNCSLGPRELGKVIGEFIKYSSVPVTLKPNAGLPDPVTGAFGLNAHDFAEETAAFAEKGVKLFGGCCGTSPQYISLLKEKLTALSAEKNNGGITPHLIRNFSAVSSGAKTVVINRPRIIGERINPTGKRLFKEALKSNDVDYILGQAIEQSRDGADILDVNVGLPEIDEKEMMTRVITALQGITDLPLQIDSTDLAVLEAALRIYNGKPIVNSVNGKEESLSAVLPLVKKYGAAVVGLTLDENGIPKTAEKRLEIAATILERALALGILREDVYIDCLTLTVSAEPDGARETLAALRTVKERLGVRLVLGVSNISFGLPNRETVNAAFLATALQAGLDLPIINPNSEPIIGAFRAYNLLAGYDKNAVAYTSAYAKGGDKQSDLTAVDLTLESAVKSGLKREAALITKRLLEIEKKPPMTIINKKLIPVLDIIGNDFENGKLFLPQLLLAAEAAGECFAVIKEKLSADNAVMKSKGKIILATVKGDIHDIGKNIVKILLENYGYEITDLGKDVPPEIIVKAAQNGNIELIGLSALMTTTLPAMAETITLLREEAGFPVNVMVGGAVLNADYAMKIGADYYAKDAKGAVDIAKKVFNK